MTLIQLYDIAEFNNIDVDYFPMKEAISISAPGLIAMDVDKIETSIHEKVCLAHELGHCQTSSFYNVYSNCDIRTRHEYRANKWAIKNLIPKTELKKAFKKGIREVWELAEYFEVTENFMRKTVEYYKYN